MPRWGLAISVGPDTIEVKDGDYILVEPGKWTTGFHVDQDTRIWKTDEDHIIATSDTPGSTY
jgi:chemotaxis signal transduction protein